MERVARLLPDGAHQRRDGAEDGARAARPRDLRRARHRRPVRSGDRVRRGRHDDRADRRPRDGAAAAQPVPRAPADRALARGRDAAANGAAPARSTWRRWSRCCCASRRWCASCRSCARWTSTRSSSTSPARWRSMRASSSTARRRRQRPRAATTSHLAILPYPARYEQRLADARRRHLHRAPDPSRTTRRCCRTWCSDLSPESRYFRFVSLVPRAAADDAVALHADRLRPRDGAGGRRARSAAPTPTATIVETERIVGVSRYITNPDQTQLRVLAGGRRRLQAARAWARG